ncbi:uncharacterized protein LOC128849825 [Cuculus canorus]|uniref:uncharacterized protein LOC128849825 n=1 Tax=Cuculus canorus TaxID=55661 RepID=UPI0023AA6774|nr:uncharacterized protein LOC128849825 [Cuculus canorus]
MRAASPARTQDGRRGRSSQLGAFSMVHPPTKEGVQGTPGGGTEEEEEEEEEEDGGQEPEASGGTGGPRGRRSTLSGRRLAGSRTITPTLSASIGSWRSDCGGWRRPWSARPSPGAWLRRCRGCWGGPPRPSPPRGPRRRRRSPRRGRGHCRPPPPFATPNKGPPNCPRASNCPP